MTTARQTISTLRSSWKTRARKPARKTMRAKSKRKEPFEERVKGFFSKIFRFAVLLTSIVVAVVLIYLFYHFLFVSEFFNVRNVTISGVSGDISDEIEGLLGLKGQDVKVNLLRIRKRTLVSAVSSHPKVYNVTVTRKLPDTLVIHAEERQPFLIVSSDYMYLVDEEGFIVDRIVNVRDFSSLPFLTGLRDVDLSVGYQIQSPHLRGIVTFLKCLEENNLRMFKNTSEINVSQDDELTVYLRGGTQILLGGGNVIDKLPSIEMFQEKVSPLDRMRYIDFRFKDQIVYYAKDIE